MAVKYAHYHTSHRPRLYEHHYIAHTTSLLFDTQHSLTLLLCYLKMLYHAASPRLSYLNLYSIAYQLYFSINLYNASATILAKSTGTALPIILYCAIFAPRNSKSSGKVCNLAASLTVILRACSGSG